MNATKTKKRINKIWLWVLGVLAIVSFAFIIAVPYFGASMTCFFYYDEQMQADGIVYDIDFYDEKGRLGTPNKIDVIITGEPEEFIVTIDPFVDEFTYGHGSFTVKLTQEGWQSAGFIETIILYYDNASVGVSRNIHKTATGLKIGGAVLGSVCLILLIVLATIRFRQQDESIETAIAKQYVEQNPKKPTPDQDGFVKCTYCGCANKPNATKCESCGARLK